MKFQKGILDDLKESAGPDTSTATHPRAVSPLSGSEEDRLFETHDRTSRSGMQYIKLLAVVSLLVVIAGAAAFYLTLPSFGDQVKAPKGLEGAVRTHFLEVEKRNSEDIFFYYCEDFYWARVEVERRPDIKTNPVYQIGTYAARAVNTGGAWDIKATPVTAPEIDRPCG
jgi:hypothetical protein